MVLPPLNMMCDDMKASLVCLQVVELFQEFFFHKMIDKIFDGFDKLVRHSKSGGSNLNYH